MKPFFKLFFTEKGEVNYLYFSFFLLCILLLSLLHYQGEELYGISLFFLFYAVVQSLLEVFLFLLIASLLQRWGPNWLFIFFIGSSFLLLIFHLTDFIMVRLMDASAKYVVKFVFGSGLLHIIAWLHALNMSWTMVSILIGAFSLVPILGLSLYWITHRFTYRKPLKLSLNQIGLSIGVLASALLLLDLLAQPYIDRPIHSQYKKTLPFGTTFLPPTTKELTLAYPQTPVRSEEETRRQIPSIAIESRPNIFFFVVETFRKDFLTVAPHLAAFAEQNIAIPSSFSNANSTQLSWFAIFHSDLPFYWSTMRDTWKQGSIPLHMLKKLGYQIDVYSSADLRFFQMDKLLFGHKEEAIDSLYTFDPALPPWKRDALALSALTQNLAPEGHVYLIFLDSPHSEYSFPDDFPLKYQPISKEIDYLTIRPTSPELELIKNRYRNSIHYVDHLIGDFLQTLKNENLYDDAILLITGDHGEEFFEEGALFHGTHLNTYQTSVPILMKFPSSDWVPQTQEATHIDLFPSILHYLTKQASFTSLFDGRSIFSIDRAPYRIAILPNGPKTPIEFTLTQSDLTLRARFITPSKLEIVELQGSLDPNSLLQTLNAKR